MPYAQNPENPTRYLTPSDIAGQLACHPSAPIRWITRGALLSNGTRLKLAAVRTPGGWRVAPDRLTEFLEALASDRITPADEPSPPTNIRTATQRRRDLERAEHELQKAGF